MRKQIKNNADTKTYELILKQTAIMCENYRATYQLNEKAIEEKLNESIKKQMQILNSDLSFSYTLKSPKKP